ncbi:MAG TPA: hypothetical protein VGF70_07160 [Solirubrobacteraceae bacterium]
MADQQFDLAASLLRADGSDARALAEALAQKLSSALPDNTRVHRRSSGVLRRQKKIEGVEVQLGDDIYSLLLTGTGATASRAKRVRGIVLRREELALDQWLSALNGALADEAQRSQAARQALEQLLEG